MNLDQLDKQQTVEVYLTALLRHMERLDVNRVHYRVVGTDEVVAVEFNNGFKKVLNVTRVEPWDIVQAVIDVAKPRR